MKYSHSIIEELDNGLFKTSIYYHGLIYGYYIEHSTFKTINECNRWLIEKRCPNLEIKYIANLPEGIINALSKSIPKSIPKAPKLYKDVCKK
jgi:hypothetical protein